MSVVTSHLLLGAVVCFGLMFSLAIIKAIQIVGGWAVIRRINGWASVDHDAEPYAGHLTWDGEVDR